MTNTTKFMIDGIDRLGKSSLIKRIQDELGYHLVIHYDKPQILQRYLDAVNESKDKLGSLQLPTGPSEENLARYCYQYDTNIRMFQLLETSKPKELFSK
jgi:hypothetical protein